MRVVEWELNGASQWEASRRWWNGLGQETRHPNLSFEWFQVWADAFLPEAAQPLILGVETDDGPILALPAYALGHTLWSMSNSHTDVFDGIGRTSSIEAWNTLATGMRRWRSVRVKRLAADSMLQRLLPSRRTVLGEIEHSPFLPLGISYPELIAGRSANARSNFRRVERRLGELGPVTFSVHSRDGDGLEGALEGGFRLEAQGWKGQAGSAILSDTRTEHFYRQLAEVAAKRHWLRVMTLKVEERMVAWQYNLLFEGRCFHLKGAYDEDLEPKPQSPGLVLLLRILQHCIEEGIESFEFTGRAEPWKTSWTDQSRSRTDFMAFPRPITGYPLAITRRYGRALIGKIRRPADG